jgi:predicted aspartyl protease
MRRRGLALIFAIMRVGLGASDSTGRTPNDLVISPEIAGRDQSHTLKLGSFVIPPSSPAGLFLKVRIDSGPVLRLLLDSGAQYIVLDKAAAAKSGHTSGSELDLIGVGKPKSARKAKAGSVRIGDLVFHDCDVIIADGKLLDGIDGVIPLSLFSGFLVRLDIPGKTLDLRPYPPDGQADAPGLTHVRASNDLLFLKAVLNDSQEGYILLDTGAFFSAVSESTARALKYPRLFASPVSLQGGVGAAEGKMLSSGVRFRFGSRLVEASPVVVVSLDELQLHHRMEVAGIVGYPALRESILTINYRDGLVGIGGK